MRIFETFGKKYLRQVENEDKSCAEDSRRIPPKVMLTVLFVRTIMLSIAKALSGQPEALLIILPLRIGGPPFRQVLQFRNGWLSFLLGYDVIKSYSIAEIGRGVLVLRRARKPVERH